MTMSLTHVVAVLCAVQLVASSVILQGIQPSTSILPNVALKKQTWQSSTLAEGDSSRAVDGNADPNWAGNSCSHTAAGDKNPWLAVDLGTQYNVVGIELTNRADCCPERENNLIIGLTNTAPNVTPPTGTAITICGRGPTVATAGQVIKVTCAAGAAPARYVVVMSPQEYLTICEFRVSATELPLTLTNVALKKQTWQSSTFSTTAGDSSRAVDGNTIPNWSVGTCSHTAAGDKNPWWAVDLGKKYNVVGIELINRADCCPERGNNLVFGLTNTAPNVTPPTVNSVTICGNGPAVAAAAQVIPVSCPAGLAPARYVVVLSPQEYLTICELEVLATDV
jgi:uncharacterized protein YuzE